MPHVQLTRLYRFSSSHRLHSPLLSDVENRAAYGKCNNPYGHGHDYVLEVAVAGEIDPRTGRLMPLPQLDRFVESVIVKKLDRRNLNTEVEEFTALVPTTENLALVLARRLEQAWGVAFHGHPARLAMVRIRETKNNIFEVRAPSAGQQRSEAAARAHALKRDPQ